MNCPKRGRVSTLQCVGIILIVLTDTLTTTTLDNIKRPQKLPGNAQPVSNLTYTVFHIRRHDTEKQSMSLHLTAPSFSNLPRVEYTLYYASI